MVKDGIFMMFQAVLHMKVFSILKMEAFAALIHSRVIPASLHGQEALPGQCADFQNNSNGSIPLMVNELIVFGGKESHFSANVKSRKSDLRLLY